MTAVRVPRAGVEGGFAPLDSGLLVPLAHLPLLSAQAAPERGAFVATDMWYSANGVAPWYETAVNSGSRGAAATGYYESEHPGVLRALSSASANSGFAWSLFHNTLVLGGHESTDIIWRIPSGGSAGTTIYLGLHDSLSVAEPVDGCYVAIAGTTLTGHCASASSRTSSASHTVSEGPWYRLHIETAASLASASFALTTCVDGATVWSATIGTNLPVGRAVGQVAVATNSGTSGKGLMDIDYLSLAINRDLAR